MLVTRQPHDTQLYGIVMFMTCLFRRPLLTGYKLGETF